MQRYFLESTYTEALPSLRLTGDDYHHAVHVMRMVVGSRCYLSFRDKRTVIAEIQQITPTEVELIEISQETMEKELPCHVTLACAYTKGDKLELVAQKATELGMSELLGFSGKTSVVKWDDKKLAKKEQRLTKICKEAAEQSHRQMQPDVRLLANMATLVKELPSYDVVLVAYEESAKEGEQATFARAIAACQPGQRLLVIFGPEGGLTPDEINLLMTHGGQVCGLGPRILRAETAPLYVLAAMSYQWELLANH